MSTCFSGIDLDYRPKTYFWARELKLKLPSDIAGAERRRLYQAEVEAGEPSVLLTDPDFCSEHLDPGLRQAWGGFHPSHLGGEFLPRRRNEEVEIARIVINSVTSDVTCVYAKRGKNRIYYQVVDEYDGETLSNRGIRTSKRPLTLRELVDFFLGSWNLLQVLNVNFWEHAYPPARVHGFVNVISSDFYPDFEDEVRRRVNDWLALKRGEPVDALGSTDEDDEDD